ncbi:putative secreted protein (type I secretion substrate), partial [Maritalea mobilis]
ITFTPGSDAISTIVFSTDVSNLSGGLTWVRVSDTQITGSDGGDTIVTLDLSVVGDVATVTATLNDNYDSHPSFTADDLQALGSVTVVATDTDGDEAEGTVNLSVSDDVPSSFNPQSGTLLNENGATYVGALDFDGNVDNNVGADQNGAISFAAALDGADSGLTSGGLAITYYLTDGGATLVGTTGGDASTGIVFTVELNHDTSDATDDSYTVTMSGTVDGGQTDIVFDANSGYAFVGGNDPWSGFTDGSGNNLDLLLTPMDGGVSDGTTNTNANSGGVNDSFIDAGEAMRLDFVNDLSGNPANSGGGSADYSDGFNQDHTFTGHYNVNGATATFTGISGGGSNPISEIRIKAFDDPDGDTTVGDGTKESITAVSIMYNAAVGTLTFDAIGTTATNITVGGVTFTVQFVMTAGTYDVLIDGVVSDTQIATFTADGYNSVEFHHESGQDFQIGEFGTTVTDPGEPVQIALDLELTDADGDSSTGTLDINLLPEAPATVDANSVSVTSPYILGTNSAAETHFLGSGANEDITGTAETNIMFGGGGNDTLNGLDGLDFLSGGDGDDVLIGGLGSDTMEGGLGADTFKVDSDSAGLTIEDVIADYNYGEGDVVDLSDLFGAIGAVDLDDDGFVSIASTGNPNEYTIKVDTDGGGDSYVDVAIITIDDGNKINILFDTGQDQDVDVI